MANRVHAPDGLFFLGLVVGYTVFYTCIFEVSKNLNIVLTRGRHRRALLNGFMLEAVKAFHVCLTALWYCALWLDESGLAPCKVFFTGYATSSSFIKIGHVGKRLTQRPVVGVRTPPS